ncbi:hypothetical protein Taro_016606 [Colocasia esculenta]|uniref:Pentatricopeptide repeat-containing protein n=1 Tax=Colocasia esculenta TaxID=4460 RepID=A0A843UTG9_COLES|nr:hypothetical protein [Colocasia esculenta]
MEREGEEGRRLRRVSGRELAKILRAEAAVAGMERKAATGTSTRRLWPKALLGALEEAISGSRWESALQLLRKQQWYHPKSRTYARLVMMLGKCGQPMHASYLFQTMLSEGLRPTLDVYTSLVGAYGHNGLWDEAFNTLDEMKSILNCKPDVCTYTILIDCCCKMHRFDLIGGALTEMRNLGIKCSTVTFNTIIDGYGKVTMLEKMEASLSDMLECDGCLPDTCTLNSIIWAYGNCGQIDKMEKWYDEFQHMGIEPDIKTFNILIKSYGKAGMRGKMSLVMDFMKKRFISPTTVTFNSLIDSFGKVGNIEKMEEIFRMMKFQGVKPNSITYSSIVSGYSKAGLLMKIPLILRQIENSDVVLDTTFFNCIISAYGQAGKIEMMEELFSLMGEKNCKPDKITFATMIQAYNAVGMHKAAQEVEIEILKLNRRLLKSLL